MTFQHIRTRVVDGDALDAKLDALRAALAVAEGALREVVAINDESAGAARKRMGTRRGNSIVAANAALEQIAKVQLSTLRRSPTACSYCARPVASPCLNMHAARACTKPAQQVQP